MIRFAVVLMGVAALAACGSAVPPRTLPATLDAQSLPSAARDALNAAWPHAWSIASLGPQVASCMAGKPSAMIVTSDFDDDGIADLAAAVTTPKGVRLVVLLGRSDHYDFFNVDGLGDQGATEGLGLAKQGDTFTKAGSLFKEFYSTNALTAYNCKGPTASYLWSGLNFYKVDLSTQP